MIAHLRCLKGLPRNLCSGPRFRPRVARSCDWAQCQVLSVEPTVTLQGHSALAGTGFHGVRSGPANHMWKLPARVPQAPGAAVTSARPRGHSRIADLLSQEGVSSFPVSTWPFPLGKLSATGQGTHAGVLHASKYVQPHSHAGAGEIIALCVWTPQSCGVRLQSVTLRQRSKRVDTYENPSYSKYIFENGLFSHLVSHR